MAEKWSRALPEPVETRDGKRFVTLRQAAEYAADQNPRNEWQNVAGALMQAARTGAAADLHVAWRALRNALFIDGLRLSAGRRFPTTPSVLTTSKAFSLAGIFLTHDRDSQGQIIFIF